MDLSDKSNEIIFFMDKSRKATRVPSGVQADLEIPKEKKRIRLFMTRTVVGRGNCDIKLDDIKVSEEHAAIGYFDGIFFILDLKSKNGTFVNGDKITERVLRDGDEVKIGDIVMSFYVSGKLHDEATERWPDGSIEVRRILEMLTEDPSTGKFDDPTRIRIEGTGKGRDKPALTQIFFEIVSGPDIGKKHHFLQKEILIGRGRGDLPLSDPDVSKRHAEIVVYGVDEIFIRDLDSTNGTFVSNKKVDRKKIKSGDFVNVGSTKMKVTFGEVIEYSEKDQYEGDDNPTQKFAGKQEYLFEILEGVDRGKSFELSIGDHIVGRGANGIPLNDPDISRAHIKIRIEYSGKVTLFDLGSTNGTFVNSKKIDKIELKPDDLIEIGKTVLKLV